MLEHYPIWARLLAKKYLSKTISHFILYGNVHDLVRKKQDDSDEYISLRTFMGQELFGSRDFVFFYDRSSELNYFDQKARKDIFEYIKSPTNPYNTLPNNPSSTFVLFEHYARVRIHKNKSIALVIDYADTIFPNIELGSASTEDRNCLVHLLRWARDPMFLAGDFTVVLITERINDIHPKLIQSPHTAIININLPTSSERYHFIEHQLAQDKTYKNSIEMTPKVVAQQTSGLGLAQIKSIFLHVKENGEPLTFDHLVKTKKEMIESEAYGLLEFVDTPYNFEYVAGHKPIKEHLKYTVNAIKKGNYNIVPMGYLVSGSVGTGKTFMVSSFANEIGVPMVKLKNFRSQWQGVTESNLEKILILLKALSPIVVMIDEADAYLGSRQNSGDSGVSNRVFSQIVTFMGNTEHRGKIIWFLITARPDLMPVDLKRQGRAEEHLSLFLPSTKEESIELFEAMKKKTNTKIDKDYIPKAILQGEKIFSGADIEALLTRSKLRAFKIGETIVTADILEETILDFLPQTYPEEIELQTLCAILECTSKSFLPQKYVNLSRKDIVGRIKQLQSMK